jgi:multidrug resistance efflux pump
MQTITPLPKRRGHGGLIAFAAIVAAAFPFLDSPNEKAIVGHLTKPPPIAVAAAPPVRVEKTQLVINAVVGYAEEVTAHVRTPVRGFVIAVPRTGRTVKRGTPLATIYSPDAVLAERALIVQVQHFTTQDLLNDARVALQRMGMPKEWISRVEKTGVPQGKLPVWAWVDGTVVANQLVPGRYVEAMTELVTITDPARRWVLAEVDEEDRARLTVGMTARLYIDGRDKPIPATIGKISRRYVRFELANPKPSVKPETPVRIELDFARS